MKIPFALSLLGYVIGLVALGCTPISHHFSWDGPKETLPNQQVAFQQDLSECHRSSVSDSNQIHMTDTTTVVFLERDVNRCLESKGWKATPTGTHAYRFDEWMREAVVVK